MYVQHTVSYHIISQQTQLRDYAKQLRKQATPAEQKMWELLRKPPFKQFHFRRQHPLFSYIVDFFSHERRLVIEIDGGIHDHQLSKDQSRDQFLRCYQYQVLRFTNEQVLYSVDSVRQAVINVLY